METGSEEIMVTIRAKNVPELIDKLKQVLGQYTALQSVQQPKVDFPEHIKQIYPEYEEHLHSAAMLTVLYTKHKGKANAVESLQLAKEMMEMFPNLFIGKTAGQVSFGNIFAGTYLKKKGLINIEKRKEDRWVYRVYWVD
jgi:hypothetical protein